MTISAEIRKKAHTASVVINPNERATFEVIYQPREVRRSQASIKVTVIDNQYEDYIVQMVGEGYKDDITLDNIGSMAVYVEPENELGNMAEEDVDGNSCVFFLLFFKCIYYVFIDRLPVCGYVFFLIQPHYGQNKEVLIFYSSIANFLD